MFRFTRLPVCCALRTPRRVCASRSLAPLRRLPTVAMDDIPTHTWSKTSDAYGSYQPAHYLLPSPRPAGHDIGAGRPWPQMNAQQLSPRVPRSWLLEQRSDTLSKSMLAHVKAGKSPRELCATSQRDITAGFSALLSSQVGYDSSLSPRHRPSKPGDAFWSLGRASDAYGPLKFRPVRGESTAMQMREKGAAARAMGRRGAGAPPPTAPTMPAS